MTTRFAAVALALLTGCSEPRVSEPSQSPESASTDAPVDTDTDDASAATSSPTAGDDASSSTTSTSEDGSSTGESLVPIEIDRAWLDSIEGSWVGPVEPTPVGPIPTFPLNFTWQDDGSLHARTDSPGGGYFDFRFHEQDGGWVFTEEGQLPGGMTQRYTLHPVEREGSRIRFVVLSSPEFLVVDVTVQDDTFEMDVDVAGIKHVVFGLSR